MPGLNGFLAVRSLEEHWAAKWRRNNDFMKTEMGRRKKVVKLVEKLAEKPNWNVPLALRFLGETYKKFMTPRKFCNFLQKTPGPGELSKTEELILAANSFIS